MSLSVVPPNIYFLDNLKVLNRISPGMSPSPSTSSWLRFSVSGSVKVVFESWNQYSVSGGRSSLLNWTEFRHHSTHTSPPSAHPRKTSIPTFQTWNSVPCRENMMGEGNKQALLCWLPLWVVELGLVWQSCTNIGSLYIICQHNSSTP